MKGNRPCNARKAIHVAMAAGLASGSALAADSVYLSVGGLTGESVEAVHKGWSDVLSFSQSASNKNCPRFVVTKYVDATTAALAAAAANGERYPVMDLAVQGADAKLAPYDYYLIKMSNVLVYSSQQSSSGGQVRATEELVLAPDTVSIQYRTSTGAQYSSIYACKGG